MIGPSDFISKPDRRVKLLVVTQAIWVATLIVLTLWWGTLLGQQSNEIANLQTQLGVPPNQVDARLEKTELMIASESGTFLILILITNGVTLFLFLRESRRSRSVQTFFASIAHELRTPLTSIKLQAEALQDIEDDPKHRPFIERLLEDVERLEGQVQRTLELARMEDGGELKLEPIQIKNFIHSKVLNSFQGSEARVKFDLALQDGYVMGDPTALTIVFRNMIDNAVKYSSSLPAQIQIRGEAKDGQPYRVDFIHLNSNFSGDTKSLGKLFHRGSNSQGAGVGLYLIQTLIRKMKGQVQFTSQPNQFAHSFSLEVDRGH